MQWLMIMIWSGCGCGRKRLWPTANKYPDSGLECLKTTKKLTDNTVSNQHLMFLTSQVWIKLWKIRHLKWKDAVCFVLLQVACGLVDINIIINSIASSINSSFNASYNEVVAATSSAGNQLSQSLNAGNQNLQTAFQNATQVIQQKAGSLKATNQQAATQIKNCVDQANMSLTANYNNASK